MTIAVREGWPERRDAWAVAAEASGNVFLTPEWAQTWWAHFGGNRTIVTLEEIDAASQLIATLVGYRCDRGPLRELRLVGHGPADELGVACAPGRRAEVVSAFGRSICAVAGFDVFVGEQLAGDVEWPAAVGGVVIDRIPSPAIVLRYRDWNDYLATRSAHFRAQLRRVERRLVEAGATIRLADDPDRLEADLTWFFHVHRSRHGESTAFASAEAFHRAFARIALARGWLALWFLELAGRPVAGLYGFRFGDAFSMYQSAIAPDGPRSTGTALLSHVVRSAIECDLDEYRFLRGGESYKLRWATHDRGLQTVAAGLTRNGRALARLASGSLRPQRTVLQRSAGRAARRALLA
jgi:CelD/BcsL family acetyltransferase involved in cellulose biosynthesis